MTDLAGTQLSSLLETLPGIATVLRSPVADAMIGLVRAASGQGSFNFSDVEELMRYAVRRNLIPADESERVLAETREAVGPVVAARPKPAAKAVTPKPVAAPRPVTARPAAPAKAARKPVPPKKSAKPARPAKARARVASRKKVAKPARAARKKK